MLASYAASEVANACRSEQSRGSVRASQRHSSLLRQSPAKGHTLILATRTTSSSHSADPL
eukprot:365720-Chlamydomonas_euryale.AAC.22